MMRNSLTCYLIDNLTRYYLSHLTSMQIHHLLLCGTKPFTLSLPRTRLITNCSPGNCMAKHYEKSQLTTTTFMCVSTTIKADTHAVPVNFLTDVASTTEQDTQPSSAITTLQHHNNLPQQMVMPVRPQVLTHLL